MGSKNYVIQDIFSKNMSYFLTQFGFFSKFN